MPNPLHTLSAKEAAALRDAVLAAATGPISVAVADIAGNSIVTARMDGAAAVSLALAAGKAHTAAAFQAPTAAITADAAGFPQLGVTLASQAGLVVLPGGVPITIDDQIVGAVGIAGGPGQADHDLAVAAIAAWTAQVDA